MRKTLIGLGCAILALPVAYLALIAFAALEHGYSWSEMDWDRDGWTTPGEFLAAVDIGKRAAIAGPKGCVEYFAYKDGMPVRIDCPASVRKAP